MPLSILFFVLGVAVSWVTLPFALQFLTGFTVAGITETRLTGEAYFGFVTTMFIIFGAVMEFPIALVLLHKLGILSVDKLQSQPADGHPGHRHLLGRGDARRRPLQPGGHERRDVSDAALEMFHYRRIRMRSRG